MIFDWFKPGSGRPRRMKVHDIEVRFEMLGSDTYAKLDQNIYSDGTGLLQLRVRDWPSDGTAAPVELWVDSAKATQWPMPGRDLTMRVADPYCDGVPKIAIGSTVELRRGLRIARGIAEAD